MFFSLGLCFLWIEEIIYHGQKGILEIDDLPPPFCDHLEEVYGLQTSMRSDRHWLHVCRTLRHVLFFMRYASREMLAQDPHSRPSLPQVKAWFTEAELAFKAQTLIDS